ELLASRRFSGEELARLYNVPPPIVGDLSHGSFANVESLLRFFAMSTLSSWARKLESALHAAAFTESERATHAVEVDLSGLMRGAPAERWKAWDVAIRDGVLSANEVREVEGWGPRPGGDTYAVVSSAPGGTPSVDAPAQPAE